MNNIYNFKKNFLHNVEINKEILEDENKLNNSFNKNNLTTYPNTADVLNINSIENKNLHNISKKYIDFNNTINKRKFNEFKSNATNALKKLYNEDEEIVKKLDFLELYDYSSYHKTKQDLINNNLFFYKSNNTNNMRGLTSTMAISNKIKSLIKNDNILKKSELSNTIKKTLSNNIDNPYENTEFDYRFNYRINKEVSNRFANINFECQKNEELKLSINKLDNLSSLRDHLIRKLEEANTELKEKKLDYDFYKTYHPEVINKDNLIFFYELFLKSKGINPVYITNATNGLVNKNTNSINYKIDNYYTINNNKSTKDILNKKNINKQNLNKNSQKRDSLITSMLDSKECNIDKITTNFKRIINNNIADSLTIDQTFLANQHKKFLDDKRNNCILTLKEEINNIENNVISNKYLLELKDIENKIIYYKNKKKVITECLINHYHKLLLDGKDTRTEGLVWIIKAIYLLGYDVITSYMPDFLDENAVAYIFINAQLSMKVQENYDNISYLKEELKSLNKDYFELEKIFKCFNVENNYDYFSNQYNIGNKCKTIIDKGTIIHGDVKLRLPKELFGNFSYNTLKKNRNLSKNQSIIFALNNYTKRSQCNSRKSSSRSKIKKISLNHIKKNEKKLKFNTKNISTYNKDNKISLKSKCLNSNNDLNSVDFQSLSSTRHAIYNSKNINSPEKEGIINKDNSIINNYKSPKRFNPETPISSILEYNRKIINQRKIAEIELEKIKTKQSKINKFINSKLLKSNNLSSEQKNFLLLEKAIRAGIQENELKSINYKNIDRYISNKQKLNPESIKLIQKIKAEEEKVQLIKEKIDYLKNNELDRIYKEIIYNNYLKRFNTNKKTIISALIGEEFLYDELNRQDKLEKVFLLLFVILLIHKN